MAYRVFHRVWWKKNPAYPNGLEPYGGARKTTIRRNVQTADEAREICRSWNANNPPGKYSRKAEFEDQ